MWGEGWEEVSGTFLWVNYPWTTSKTHCLTGMTSICVCVFMCVHIRSKITTLAESPSRGNHCLLLQFHSQSIQSAFAAVWLQEVWAFVFVPSKTVINLGNSVLRFFSLPSEWKQNPRHCCCQFCHLLGMRPETNPRWKEHEDIIPCAAWWIKISVMPQASAQEENPALFSIQDVWLKKMALSGFFILMSSSFSPSLPLQCNVFSRFVATRRPHRIKPTWQTEYSHLQWEYSSFWHFPKELTSLMVFASL